MHSFLCTEDCRLSSVPGVDEVLLFVVESQSVFSLPEEMMILFLRNTGARLPEGDNARTTGEDDVVFLGYSDPLSNQS
jgi:hypothetical protein